MMQEDEMDVRHRRALAESREAPAVELPAGDPVTAGLRNMFKAYEQEPIPEDFLRLLDDIEARAIETQEEIGTPGVSNDPATPRGTLQ
jgi:Anti-sigma factor NepR